MSGLCRIRILATNALVVWMAIQATAVGQPSSVERSSEIHWTENLDAAMQNAQATNRPLMLHFYGDNCPPCRLLERKTFHDSNLIHTIHSNVIPVRINADRNRKIADQFTVTRWPTDVYLLPNGEELHRGISNSDPNVYAETIKRIALRHRDWSAQQAAMAKYQDRVQAREVAATLPASRSKMPVESVVPRHPTRIGATRDGAKQADLPVVTNVSSLKQVSNPYAAMAEEDSDDLSNAQKEPPVVVGRPNASLVASNQSVVATPSNDAMGNARMVTVPVASQISDNTNVNATVPTASNAPVDKPATSSAVALLTNAPGLEGYCPVSLRKSILASAQGLSTTEAWVRGNEQCSVRHRGRIYRCANETMRQEFLANPDLYAPILSGCDLIDFLQSGQLFDGKCEFGFIDQQTGRVYLFRTQENCAEFSRNCEAYARVVEAQASEHVAKDLNANVQR